MTEPTTAPGNPMISINHRLYLSAVVSRERLDAAREQFEKAKQTASDCRKELEAAQTNFERAFRDLEQAERGEDLPLFNQTDQITDVSAQVETLVTHLQRADPEDADGWARSALIVAGWTPEERAAAGAYASAVIQWRDSGEAADGVRGPDTPDFFPDLP